MFEKLSEVGVVGFTLSTTTVLDTTEELIVPSFAVKNIQKVPSPDESSVNESQVNEISLAATFVTVLMA